MRNNKSLNTKLERRIRRRRMLLFCCCCCGILGRERGERKADDNSGATGNRTSLQCDPVDEIFARSTREKDSEKNIVVALLLLGFTSCPHRRNVCQMEWKGVESLFGGKEGRGQTH